jgi:hypothetical protein
MSIIIDSLSDIIKDRIGVLEFNTDFRTSMLFEMLMQDRNIRKKNKIIQAIKLYYPDVGQITDYEKAVEDILWFYRCGKELANSNNVSAENKSKQVYSYEFDDNYIYSAFLQQYNVDLQDTEYLHWWKFRAMFDGLSKETKIVEIMGYRAIDLRTIKDKEEKKRIKKLKELYKLPDMRTREQKEADFGRAFW